MPFNFVLIMTIKQVNERQRKKSIIKSFYRVPIVGSKFFVEKKPAEENATAPIPIIGDSKDNLKDL